MSYVLVLIGAFGVTMHDFDSRNACQVAVTAIADQTRNVTMACIPKGDEK